MSQEILFSIFLVFTGAALLSTVALFARQTLLVAYIGLGVLLGPSGFSLVSDTDLISEIAHIGIIFLLFLLGLNLYPQKLIQLFRQTTIVVIFSTVIFAVVGYSIAALAGLGRGDSMAVGVAVVFSSTIVGLKLLPTTVLHHRHTGEVVVSILLLQDLIAIVALMMIKGLNSDSMAFSGIIQLVVALPSLLLVAWAVEHFVLQPLFARFDRFPEYIFLLAIGWCLGVAQSAESLGLSYEIGAFFGGVAVATSPIARHIAESLRPLRDFFLVMFFFAIGAGFDLSGAREIWWAALLLAAGVLLLKPLVYRLLLVGVAESRELGLEIGWRLGQMSEFSLLIVFIGAQSGLISERAVNLVQFATLLTFIGSSYLVVLRYPTPIALTDRLRRD